MASINSYTVFNTVNVNGRNVVIVEETEEYFKNGDIITVSEYHFANNGREFGWARVQSDEQHHRIIGDKELLVKFQLLQA